VVERGAGRGWKRIATLRTGSDGVFLLRFRARANGRYRARVAHGPVSLAYDSTAIPPRRHACSTPGERLGRWVHPYPGV